MGTQGCRDQGSDISSDSDACDNNEENLLLLERNKTEEHTGELSSIQPWIYYITFMLTSFITWGIIGTFPVYLVAFLEYFDQTRAETSSVPSIQVSITDLIVSLWGCIVNRSIISKIGYHPCLLMCKEIHLCVGIELIGKECRALSINSCLFTNWISTGTMTSPHPYMIMLWGWFLNSVQQCRIQLQILTYIFH